MLPPDPETAGGLGLSLVDEPEFIDMSHLRVLVATAEDAIRDGWSVAATRGSAQVRRLIGLVEFDRQLPLEGHTR